MYADKLNVSCYGDKKILSKLKYFFKEDFYELSDVKLDERINVLRINLKYIYYNNPISEYFKNEENTLSERSLIYIYFLYLNNLEEYKKEKESILNRYKENSMNDEYDECIIIYAYNLDDNLNEIKNIKKIKADFSHNSCKSIKILSFPILKMEDYDSNKKMKELYEHFKTRYMDHIKICIEKKYNLIKNGFSKSMNNFLNYVESKKKTITEEINNNNSNNHSSNNHSSNNHSSNNHSSNNHSSNNHSSNNHGGNKHSGNNHSGNYNSYNYSNYNSSSTGGKKKKKNKRFYIANTYIEKNEEETQIEEFLEFYENHAVFLFCNDYVNINFFLRQNDVSSYINALEFITDYEEQVYVDMYDLFLSLFMWSEHLCLLYFKLNMFKKSYVLYSTIAKLFIKYLNVYIKKKKCIIHSSILFEKNYLTIARYIREKNICSIHLLEYIFFKKFTILLFLNKFSYISSKALKFAKFFYTNKIFIFMHNFHRFKNNLTRNAENLNYLKNIQKKITKYRRKELIKKNAQHCVGDKNELPIEEDQQHDDQHDEQHDEQQEKRNQRKVNQHYLSKYDHKLYKCKRRLINELRWIFSSTGGNDPSCKDILDRIAGSAISSAVYGVGNAVDDTIEQAEESATESSVNNTNNVDNPENIREPGRNINNRIRCSNRNLFLDERTKAEFLLNCCFINKENYFSIYFYNLANLIKFLFERRSYFYQEDYKKNKNDKNIKKNTNISKYLSLQKNIMKLGYKKNFTKKKKSKKNVKVKTKRNSSVVNSSSSQISSTLSDFSDSKNNYKKICLHNDFCINVSNIFKLSFVILKNILNIYNYNSLYYQKYAQEIYLCNFFLNYLEQKRFEQNIEKEDIQEIKNAKKNIYHNFPIYQIKNFSKDNEKKKNSLLINIMNKIINLCYRKYNNISIINKFFLALLLFENKIYKKSFKILKRIIQKSNFDVLTTLCMQLLLFHDINNNFYHFCSSFFLSNKYTRILSFINVNINFTVIQNYQYYLYSMNNQRSVLKMEQHKKYDEIFFNSLKKNIVLPEEIVKMQVLDITQGGKQWGTPLNCLTECKAECVTNCMTECFAECLPEVTDEGMKLPIHESQTKKVEGERKKKKKEKTIPTNRHYTQNGKINKNVATKMNRNKLIKLEKKEFCKDNYYFEINRYFLKSLKKYNFSLSTNERNNDIYIPNSGIKIFVQSDYNLYIFVSNMIFGNYDEKKMSNKWEFPSNEENKTSNEQNNNSYYQMETNENMNANINHIETLLHMTMRKYKVKKKTREILRIKKLCVQYDENLDLFIFSSFTQDLHIDNIIIQLYNERDNNSLYLKFHRTKQIIKHGLNIIKLNVVNILESNKIIWKHFYYKINYVFLVINNFSFYQKIGILPNSSLVYPFLRAYSQFIINNYIIVDTKKYANFFLNQLVSSLYVKIKTLDSILNCKLIASYLNSTSLVYNNVNYIKLIVRNNHKHMHYEDFELITIRRSDDKAGKEVRNIKIFLQKAEGIRSSSRTANIRSNSRTANICSNSRTANICSNIRTANICSNSRTANICSNSRTANIGNNSGTANRNNTLENHSVEDFIHFYIEKNDNMQIEQMKILDDEEMLLIKNSSSTSSNMSMHILNNEKYNLKKCSLKVKEKKDESHVEAYKRIDNAYAIISFIPKRINTNPITCNENCTESLKGEGNSSVVPLTDNLLISHNKSQNRTEKVKIKCIINIDLLRKKRRERRTDMYKLSNINYVGKIKFDDFINREEITSNPCLNNQIIIEKTFDLVNIFKEKINTYRSNNGMLYELILKLHNDNYALYLKKFHITILKKYITQIKSTKIFLLNNEDNQHNMEKFFLKRNNHNDLAENSIYNGNESSLNYSGECNSSPSNENYMNKSGESHSNLPNENSMNESGESHSNLPNENSMNES
ncbi:hypothetical protein, conserved [Plasmodium malariae]|uniref:Uncharacterized protein n=1 Tax=Plasmodium malariae TaxID=5858 RepID=A0A1A8VZD3_PLAMA|nr:hypothetical protein, conserved [Plasmodium malariae]